MTSHTAWFRSHLGTKVRVYLRGWFSPLHGTVEDVVKDKALVGGKWICIAGPKSQVQSMETT